MTPTVARRVLFAAVPIELGTGALLITGFDLPPALRWGVGALVIATVVVEIWFWLKAFVRSRRQGRSMRQAGHDATQFIILVSGGAFGF